MSKSKTAAAADKAVAKSQQKGTEVLTPEQRISNIYKNASQGLSVTSEDILLLHAALCSALVTISGLNTDVTRLTAQNEEFRAVYEHENRSMGVKVERFDEVGDVKVETTVAANGGEAGLLATALNNSSSGE